MQPPIAPRAGSIEAEALRVLAIDLADVPADCWRFFGTMFTTPDVVRSVPKLGFEVNEQTLVSRFQRAGLPAPKTYLDQVFLIRIAGAHAEHPRSFYQLVVDLFEGSYPQSIGRSIHRLTGQTAGVWLPTSDAVALLRDFRSELVEPFIGRLKGFHPLVSDARNPRNLAGAA